ncbi:MAG TPA: VWA domain-containing protein, partial [Niastella sp.]
SYLKTELLDVINQVKSTNSNYIIRTGAVFYRDEGDDYVTKRSDFTTNSNATLDFIRDQSAGGGGDFPEAVHTAVKEAVQQLAWSSRAKSRIMFLVLDAPPHDNDAVMATLAEQVKAAAKKGIRVVPITASGINKLTEYLMRQIAIATNGTYVFITNDSGIGNNHLEPTVGEFKVEYLNNLMVRLINQYLE